MNKKKLYIVLFVNFFSTVLLAQEYSIYDYFFTPSGKYYIIDVNAHTVKIGRSENTLIVSEQRKLVSGELLGIDAQRYNLSIHLNDSAIDSLRKLFFTPEEIRQFVMCSDGAGNISVFLAINPQSGLVQEVEFCVNFGSDSCPILKIPMEKLEEIELFIKHNIKFSIPENKRDVNYIFYAILLLSENGVWLERYVNN